MVVDLGGIDALETALVAVAVCCCARMECCCRAVRRAARRRVKTVRAAVEQDMYMDIAGHRGSMALGREWMWRMRDQERRAAALSGA